MGAHITFNMLFSGSALTEIDLPDDLTWDDVAEWGVRYGTLRLDLRDGRKLEYPVEIELMKDPDNVTVLDGKTKAVLDER